MDEETHKTWWPLHLRNALGETLTPEERGFYESGLKELEDEEVLHYDEGAARQQEEELARLEARRDELTRQWEALQEELRRLLARRKPTKSRPVGVAN